jgi:hypothetical protein
MDESGMITAQMGRTVDQKMVAVAWDALYNTSLSLQTFLSSYVTDSQMPPINTGLSNWKRMPLDDSTQPGPSNVHLLEPDPSNSNFLDHVFPQVYCLVPEITILCQKLQSEKRSLVRRKRKQVKENSN